jgi:pimeloyl-ACP methyl ester carboxylesterase
MSITDKVTIVLVHGAWHGSWCWKFQIPMLEALGYAVENVDLPCTSGVAGTTQFDDAAHVRSVVESLLDKGKRVVVLAHSYGGPIGSAALTGLSGKSNGLLLGLIALSAYILPSGMDQGAVIRSIGGLPYVSWDTPSEGLFIAKDPTSLLFKPDVPADRIAWALTQLRPQSMAANMGIVPPQVWQDSTYTGQLGYIRCTADVIIPLEQQDSMIKEAGGEGKWLVRTLEGSGHSPFLSRPDQVAATVDEIIKQFEARL